mmetsp:Transcript_33616/g.78642  ORF Transcript_33616/g.78642 Transcript_33616/m.78642 type:complete len:234 (+) Transcript_33616:156-857(+)
MAAARNNVGCGSLEEPPRSSMLTSPLVSVNPLSTVHVRPCSRARCTCSLRPEMQARARHLALPGIDAVRGHVADAPTRSTRAQQAAEYEAPSPWPHAEPEPPPSCAASPEAVRRAFGAQSSAQAAPPSGVGVQPHPLGRAGAPFVTRARGHLLDWPARAVSPLAAHAHAPWHALSGASRAPGLPNVRCRSTLITETVRSHACMRVRPEKRTRLSVNACVYNAATTFLGAAFLA